MDFIRKFIPSDIDTVMKIWYEGNIEAHDFISKEYWDRNYQYVKRVISQAEVYVYETNGRVAGFVGMDDGYLEGLFVEKDYRGLGFGTRLLDYIKEENDHFLLHVFANNYGAYSFYQKRGLKVRSEEVNEDLGEVEYLMYYKKKKEED